MTRESNVGGAGAPDHRRRAAGRCGLAAVLVLVAAVACGEATDEPASPILSVELEPQAPGEAADSPSARDAFERWVPLITAGRFEEARALCTPWLENADPGFRTEAHKCLANVVIADDSLSMSAYDPQDFRPQGPRVGAEGVDRALAHYDAAILLTPNDRDAHIGRADVLILGGRFEDANQSVEESLQRLTRRTDLDAFLLLTARYRMLNRNAEAFDFLKVLERHHPLDHRVVANLGAFHAILGRNEEALEYAKRAVALAPDDPLNRWNLAQLYERQNELELADSTYRKALDLLQDTDPGARCRYAEFIAERLGDTSRACDYALLECPSHFEERCEGAERSKAAAPHPPSS